MEAPGGCADTGTIPLSGCVGPRLGWPRPPEGAAAGAAAGAALGIATCPPSSPFCPVFIPGPKLSFGGDGLPLGLDPGDPGDPGDVFGESGDEPGDESGDVSEEGGLPVSTTV